MIDRNPDTNLRDKRSVNRADIHYVGFWARFTAFIIDSVVASLLLTPMAMTSRNIDIAKLSASDPNESSAYLQSLLAPMMLQTVVVAAIIIAFWIFFSATPGKMLFRSYIVNAADFGKASTTQLLVRYLGYFISLFVFGLGFVWIGLDKRKQGLHDKIARTVVINQKPLDTKTKP
ncbi:MAG: RDD family protein [bacterium]|nr:RDD family protein [Gammaproteobacteria bacterium]HIL94897.1 RDD family protein [Pseudomonadales bacterium]